jgi:hypothetical protein
MPILLRLILTGLVAFSIGVASAPLWLTLVRESTPVIAPFSILSLAILAFSIAYAINTIRRPPR